MADDFGGGFLGNIFGDMFGPQDAAGSDPTGAGGLYDVKTQGPAPQIDRGPTAQSDPDAPMRPPQASPLSGTPPNQPQQQGGGFMDQVGSLFGAGGKQSGHGLFGTDLILPGVLGRPSYKTDPNASPSDQAASMMQQQMDRAGQVANSPFVQLFNPDEAKRARDFLTEAPQKMAQLKGLQQKQNDQMQEARNFGVPESQVNPYITDDTIDNHLLAQYRAGDISARNQLLARGKGEWVTSFQAEAVDAYQTKASTASEAIGKLRNATDSPAMYAAAVKSLPPEQVKALTGFIQEAGGTGIPDTPEKFKALQAQHGAKFMQMRQTLSTMQRQTQVMQDFATPMAKEAAEQYGGNFRIPGTQESMGLPVYVRSMDGQPGAIGPDGSAREELFGKQGGANFSTPERLKNLRETTEGAVPKAELEKYRHGNRLYGMATTDAQGNALAPGKINTNPNVQQGIAEGLASELRGGMGGANVGLLKIEGDKRGWTQAMLDKMRAGWAGVANVIDGPDGKKKEYLTDETQRQMREVLDYLHDYNNTNIKDRLGGVARQAGRYGIPLKDAGLADVEDSLASDYEGGRIETVNGLRAMPRIVRGNQSIYFPQGSMVPGAEEARKDLPVPPTNRAAIQQGASPAAQAAVAARPPGQQPSPVGPAPADPSLGDASKPIPGERNIKPYTPPGGPSSPAPLPTPQTGMMSRAGGAPAPQPGAPSGPSPLAAGPQAASIGGQNVMARAPAGASSSYVARMQGIESGGESNPWTSTTRKSSASGAFQFLDGTWASNKPVGAPARAKDATPAQQVQALENFTAKNAAAMGARGLPVNDATLYMAHNLGVSGAQALLKADPSANAAKVVGAKAAANNPSFFSGNATVGEAIARYQAKMGAGGGGVALPSSVQPGQRPAFGAQGAAMPIDAAGGEEGHGVAPIPGWASKRKAQAETNNQNAASAETVAGFAPAAGSTLGAIGGGVAGAAVGGPVGAVAGGVVGGAAGGALGQAIKDRALGNEQSAARLTKEAALGAVFGVMPEGRPIMGAAARMLGAGAVEGGSAYVEGKKPSEIAESAAKGVGEAAAGEAVGRALGMVGHKIFSNFTETAQEGLIKAGNTVADGRKALESMNPKLATGEANPTFEKLTNDVKAAETKIKEAGLDVDNFAYATQQVKSGTSKGEAKIMQTAQGEQQRLGEQYNELHGRAGQAPGAVKANIPIEDGPLSKIRSADNPTGKVDPRYADDAQHAEMLIRAPAPNWEAKSRQLQQAGSELLAKGRVFAANNDEVGEKAMRELFSGVREQQIKMANALMKPGEASKFVTDLKTTDKAYSKLMDATDGMNYQKMQAAMAQGNTPNARKIEAAFKDLAGNDKDAMRVFNAMKASARGEYASSHRLMGPIMKGIHGTLQYAPLGLDKIARAMDAYAHFRMLGQHVKMSDIVAGMHGNAGQQAGAAGSRVMTMD